MNNIFDKIKNLFQKLTKSNNKVSADYSHINIELSYHSISRIRSRLSQPPDIVHKNLQKLFAINKIDYKSLKNNIKFALVYREKFVFIFSKKKEKLVLITCWDEREFNRKKSYEQTFRKDLIFNIVK